MSEIASVVERTRKAFAVVSRLEEALARDPSDRALQMNLTAMRKMAVQAEQQLMEYSREAHVEVCNYRLVPEATEDLNFSLMSVAKSFLAYQNLFSQIHDALRNGIKQRAIVGSEAAAESALQFGYSYSGSLGVVLLAPSEREFFEGSLDRTIEALFETLSVQRAGDVREIVEKFGRPVVKRIHDWSEANVEGGFAADIRWNRSDGRGLGEVIERSRMARIIHLMAEASDERRHTFEVDGLLVGGDVLSGSFHFVVPGGEHYRGLVGDDFAVHGKIVLNERYSAVLREVVIEKYATEETIRRFELVKLNPPIDDESQVELH